MTIVSPVQRSRRDIFLSGPKKTGARPRFFQPATLPNRRAGEVSRWLRLNATRDFFDWIPPSSAGVSKQTIAINGQITLSPNPGNKGLPKKTGAKPRFFQPFRLALSGAGEVLCMAVRLHHLRKSRFQCGSEGYKHPGHRPGTVHTCGKLSVRC